MAKRDIIVMGASAGGVEALTRIAAGLDKHLDAAIFVTVHFPRASTSVLPKILSRAGRMEAVHPEDGERIRHGHIYVAPPDWHMLIRRGRISLVRGPTENGNRPAVDPMFRSAAVAYGPRVIGVVLTGNLDDGTGGLLAIRRHGGVAIVQDPDEALFPSMPVSAIDHGAANHVVTLDALPGLLGRLSSEDIDGGPEDIMDDEAEKETEYSRFDMEAIENPAEHPGVPSPFGCPDCGGVLWAIADGDTSRFRCRVGHGWTNDALLAQQSATLETALWTALRALEESAALNRQLAGRVHARRGHEAAQRFRDNAREAEQRAHVIRDVLVEHRPTGEQPAFAAFMPKAQPGD